MGSAGRRTARALRSCGGLGDLRCDSRDAMAPPLPAREPAAAAGPNRVVVSHARAGHRHLLHRGGPKLSARSRRRRLRAGDGIQRLDLSPEWQAREAGGPWRTPHVLRSRERHLYAAVRPHPDEGPRLLGGPVFRPRVGVVRRDAARGRPRNAGGRLFRGQPGELPVIGLRRGRERRSGRKSNTEARSHGGRTEGLWPARLRRAGRTRPTVRHASAPVSLRAFAFRTVDLVRAARSAAPQAFPHAALRWLLEFFSVRPPCLRVSVMNSSPRSPSSPLPLTPGSPPRSGYGVTRLAGSPARHPWPITSRAARRAADDRHIMSG